MFHCQVYRHSFSVSSSVSAAASLAAARISVRTFSDAAASELIVSRTIYCGVLFRIKMIFPRYSPMTPSTMSTRPNSTTITHKVEDQPTGTSG